MIAGGEFLESICEFTLRLGFFVRIRKCGHQIVRQKQLAAVTPRRQLKDLQDAFRLICLKDFLIVEQIKSIAVVIQQPLLHGIGYAWNANIADGIIFQADIFRTRGLQVDPFLKFLLGQLAGIGADAVPLFDGI